MEGCVCFLLEPILLPNGLPCHEDRGATNNYPAWANPVNLSLQKEASRANSQIRTSPNIYVVVSSYTQSSDCSLVLSYDKFTGTLHPDEVSTYGAGGIPARFNFADMPCGPPGLTLPSDESSFKPWFMAPDSLMQSMGIGNCSLNSWLDPSMALIPAQGVDGPGVLAGPRKHPCRKAPAQAMPWVEAVPTSTP